MNATSEHPRLVISLSTRTRTFGTFNVAVALRGRSSGWGRQKGKPRRTFVGHHRTGRHEGLHFIEFALKRGAMFEPIWSRRIDLHQGAKSDG